MTECFIQVENDNEPVRCDNCDWTGIATDLEMVSDIQERINPGHEVPAGQCPECGALAYLKNPPEYSVTFKASACDRIAPVLREAIEAWPQFNPQHPRHDEEVNGGDLVEWFGGYLEKVKAAIAGVPICPVALASPTLTVWTCTTDGDNCPLTTSVHATQAEAFERVRDDLRADCKPSQLAHLNAMPTAGLADAWVSANDGSCIVESHEIGAALTDEDRANAKLYAAAPSMLAALERVARSPDCSRAVSEYYDVLAAIASAKGEAFTKPAGA